MNEHDSILALIPGYPELRSPERQKIDQHAQTCDACAAALQRQQRLRSQLAHAPRLLPDPAAVEAVRAAVRQKASPSATASRGVVRPRWLTVAAPAGVFALIVVLVGLLIVRQGWLPGSDPLPNIPFGRGQGSLPAAQSAAVGQFVWQTDDVYGYEMLRPAGWAMSDTDSNRVFTAPGSGEEEALALQVLNLRAKPIAETRWGMGHWRDLFEAGSTLQDWTARLEEYDFRGMEKAVPPEDLAAEVVIYVGQTATRQMQLMAFKVSDGQPLLVSLAGGAAAYDLDALKANGLWDDFLTMLRSARAIPLDPQNVSPALISPAASPTPEAVIATRVVTVIPEPGPAGPASLIGPVPTPASSLIGSFVTLVARDYQMLQPLGWEAVDHGMSYGYVAPGSRGAIDGIELQVVNYAAQFANRPQTTNPASAEWLAFQQNPTLAGWTAAIVLSWPSMGLQPVELRELTEAIIYTYEYPNSNPPARALVAYKVDRGQPLGVVLTAKGAYADLDRLRREGLVDDFVTMVESLRATADSQPVAPAVATVAPALPNPDAASLGRLLQGEASRVTLLQAEASGLKAQLTAVALTESELFAEFCLDLPDSRDWHPMPRLSQGERQAEGYSMSLVDAKLTQTMYATHRCYRYTSSLPSPGVSVVEPLTLSIERLALEPNEGEVGQAATCQAALRRLAERQPDIRAACVDRADGTFPELVSLPEGMVRDQAQRLIHEGYPEFVEGPWTFTIPMTNINPTQP